MYALIILHIQQQEWNKIEHTAKIKRIQKWHTTNKVTTNTTA